MKIIFAFLFLIGLVGYAHAYHDDIATRGTDDPKIALYDNSVYVVWKEGTGPDYWDVFFTKSTDEGKTFEEPRNLTNRAAFYPDPEIIASKNNVYILWEDRINPDDGIETTYFTKSNDGGETFSEIISLDPFQQGKDLKFFPISMITANDSLYVFVELWDKQKPQQKNLAFISSDDFGNTFSEPTIVFDSEQWGDLADIVSDENGSIYVLGDDPKNYDEKGDLNFRKIFSDGRLGNVTSVNNKSTAVTNAQLSVSGDNVYVVWRAWENQRWFPMFAKSNDGGETFEEYVNIKPNTDSVDTAWTDGRHVFSHGDSVYVIWPEEYWDGKTQTFSSWIAKSDDEGSNFEIIPAPLNDKLVMSSKLWAWQNKGEILIMAPTLKNHPYEEPALYVTKSTDGVSFSDPIDFLEDTPPSFRSPDFAVNDNGLQIVAKGDSSEHCILYLKEQDGKTTMQNLSSFGDDSKCLGVEQIPLSPLKQSNMGVKPFDVKCKQDHATGFILALREYDGYPVCITTGSYLTLVERGIIQENSGETLALQTAKNFVASSPTFSFDGIEDSIELNVTNTRKSIPPVVTIQGSFLSSNPGYGERTGQEFPDELKIHKKEITLEIAQVNKIHSAIIDDTWDEINQKIKESTQPDRTSWFRSGPTSHIKLSIGDQVDSRGLVPLYITEISENVSGQITFWQFQPTREDSASNRGRTWDFLPESQRQQWEFVDENGDNAWDDSVIPQDMFAITLEGHNYPAVCGDTRFEGNSYHPATIPIKPETKTIFAKSGQIGFLPDSEGVYSIQYISLFDTIVEFPENAKIIENKKELCIMDQTIKDSTHAFHTSMVFKLEGSNVSALDSSNFVTPARKNPPQQPYEGAILGDAHEHASILVKIFGDRFDFSQPKFQIKSSWIHFEGLEGNTIHRHSKNVTLGYLFETLQIGLSDQCFVFDDGREFCTNEEYSLKFYINGKQVDEINSYIISDGDRILVSYGQENKEEIDEQIADLDAQEIVA